MYGACVFFIFACTGLRGIFCLSYLGDPYIYIISLCLVFVRSCVFGSCACARVAVCL